MIVRTSRVAVRWEPTPLKRRACPLVLLGGTDRMLGAWTWTGHPFPVVSVILMATVRVRTATVTDP